MKFSVSILIAFIIFHLPLHAQITEIGQASFYADKFDGRITASGDVFDQNKLTAAHRTLPFGSKVKVINLENKKEVVVMINDRGPFVNDRVIDLSKKAAKKLDFIDAGVTKVKIEVVYLADANRTKNKPKAKPQPQPQKVEVVEKPIKKTPKDTPAATSNGLEYYQVNSTLISPKGYGIQVASYKEASNLMKQCHMLEREVGKNIMVEVSNSNGNKLYRVIVGPFATKGEASQFHAKIKNKFKGCFVVSFE